MKQIVFATKTAGAKETSGSLAKRLAIHKENNWFVPQKIQNLTKPNVLLRIGLISEEVSKIQIHVPRYPIKLYPFRGQFPKFVRSALLVSLLRKNLGSTELVIQSSMTW